MNTSRLNNKYFLFWRAMGFLKWSSKVSTPSIPAMSEWLVAGFSFFSIRGNPRPCPLSRYPLFMGNPQGRSFANFSIIHRARLSNVRTLPHTRRLPSSLLRRSRACLPRAVDFPVSAGRQRARGQGFGLYRAEATNTSRGPNTYNR